MYISRDKIEVYLYKYIVISLKRHNMNVTWMWKKLKPLWAQVTISVNSTRVYSTLWVLFFFLCWVTNKQLTFVQMQMCARHKTQALLTVSWSLLTDCKVFISFVFLAYLLRGGSGETVFHFAVFFAWASSCSFFFMVLN